MNPHYKIWFCRLCSFFPEPMQRKALWCAGWLLSLATFTVPQIGVAAPLPQSDLPLLFQTQDDPLRLVIRRKQRRVTVYRNEQKVKSYAIAIGKAGWETPKGTFKIQQMQRDPIWIHPFTGEKVPGGDPENPLGRFWIGFWTDGNNWIGFHGTPNPNSVGRAASHGCVRMYNQDIKELFAKVTLGTEVTVID